MKNIIKILVLITLSLSYCYSNSSKASSQTEVLYEHVTILENGVKRKISVLKTNNTKKTVSTYDAKANKGLIVSFKNIEETSIPEFEKKYGLKLRKKLIIGYYIFANVSAKTDMEIVQAIIQNEVNIQTVKPNWKMKNVPY